MKQIPLGNTGRSTTRLGYGCSRLMGSIGGRESAALLEAAYDAGIRHFDVAPAYGDGQAEVCVGDFLSRHRAEVTVATKYGVPVGSPAGLKLGMRRFATSLVEKVPGLKQRLKRAQSTAKPTGAQPRQLLQFNADFVQLSIENSLKLLKTDHLDLFLLHEVIVDDLVDTTQTDDLLRLLETLVQSGKIGAFGCASGRESISPLTLQQPQFCQVLQHEWSILDPVFPPGPFRILHRALSEHFTQLHSTLIEDKSRATRWSDAIGADITSYDLLSHLMLKASLVSNPDSVILFSSRSPRHIQANIALVDDKKSEQQAKELYALIQAEPRPLLNQA